MKGRLARVSDSMSTLAITLVMNSAAPTGGVCCPIPQHNTTTIPKWIGSMPSISIAGKNSGTIMKIIAIPSRKVPAMIMMTLSITRNMTGDRSISASGRRMLSASCS